MNVNSNNSQDSNAEYAHVAYPPQFGEVPYPKNHANLVKNEVNSRNDLPPPYESHMRSQEIVETMRTPFCTPIMGGIGRGKVVIFRGVVTGNSFSINLQQGYSLEPNNVYLHINPRLYEGHVVLNSAINGYWGNQFRTEALLKLVRGELFEMKIFCKRFLFMITLNGRHMAMFRHRASYKTIDHVLVRGDCSIEYLQVHYTDRSSCSIQ
ncbi:hypothetical protein SNEBB_002564 [Seison nebaliae]|nr:hypothetical protein SNEBB_002564 [Seison nebaliae]